MNEIINDSNELQNQVLEIMRNVNNEEPTNKSAKELSCVISFLKQTKLFHLIREDHHYDEILMETALKLKFTKFKYGEFLFHYGEKGDNIYFVLSGTGSVFVPKEDYEINQELLQKQKKEVEESSGCQEIQIQCEENQKEINDNLIQDQIKMEKAKLLALNDKHVTRYFSRSKEYSTYKFVRVMHFLNYFGDLALGDQYKKRMASVVCCSQEDFELGYISLLEFQDIFKDATEELYAVQNALLNHLVNISKRQIINLSFLFAYTIKCDRGQVIYSEGQQANAIFIIKKGLVSISKSSTTNSKGELKLAILSQKEILGHEDIFSEDGQRNVTAVAIQSGTEVVYAKIEELMVLFDQCIEVKQEIQRKSQLKFDFYNKRIQSIQNVEKKQDLSYINLKEKISFQSLDQQDNHTNQNSIFTKFLKLSQDKGSKSSSLTLQDLHLQEFNKGDFDKEASPLSKRLKANLDISFGEAYQKSQFGNRSNQTIKMPGSEQLIHQIDESQELKSGDCSPYCNPKLISQKNIFLETGSQQRIGSSQKIPEKDSSGFLGNQRQKKIPNPSFHSQLKMKNGNTSMTPLDDSIMNNESALHSSNQLELKPKGAMKLSEMITKKLKDSMSKTNNPISNIESQFKPSNQSLNGGSNTLKQNVELPQNSNADQATNKVPIIINCKGKQEIGGEIKMTYLHNDMETFENTKKFVILRRSKKKIDERVQTAQSSSPSLMKIQKQVELRQLEDYENNNTQKQQNFKTDRGNPIFNKFSCFEPTIPSLRSSNFSIKESQGKGLKNVHHNLNLLKINSSSYPKQSIRMQLSQDDKMDVSKEITSIENLKTSNFQREGSLTVKQDFIKQRGSHLLCNLERASSKNITEPLNSMHFKTAISQEGTPKNSRFLQFEREQNMVSQDSKDLFHLSQGSIQKGQFSNNKISEQKSVVPEMHSNKSLILPKELQDHHLNYPTSTFFNMAFHNQVETHKDIFGIPEKVNSPIIIQSLEEPKQSNSLINSQLNRISYVQPSFGEFIYQNTPERVVTDKGVQNTIHRDASAVNNSLQIKMYSNYSSPPKSISTSNKQLSKSAQSCSTAIKSQLNSLYPPSLSNLNDNLTSQDDNEEATIYNSQKKFNQSKTSFSNFVRADKSVIDKQTLTYSNSSASQNRNPYQANFNRLYNLFHSNGNRMKNINNESGTNEKTFLEDKTKGMNWNGLNKKRSTLKQNNISQKIISSIFPHNLRNEQIFKRSISPPSSINKLALQGAFDHKLATKILSTPNLNSSFIVQSQQMKIIPYKVQQ